MAASPRMDDPPPPVVMQQIAFVQTVAAMGSVEARAAGGRRQACFANTAAVGRAVDAGSVCLAAGVLGIISGVRAVDH